MKAYKLTNSKHQTHGNSQWGENITHTTTGVGNLCGSGWIHYYDSPELAILLNPIHAAFNDPILWEAEAQGKFLHDHGLKSGCTILTTRQVIPTPKVTTEQRVKFSIHCALAVYPDEKFAKWSNAWLDGSDRSAETAWAAEEWAARAAARAAEWAARAAEWAARATNLDLIALANKALDT